MVKRVPGPRPPAPVRPKGKELLVSGTGETNPVQGWSIVCPSCGAGVAMKRELAGE